MAFRTPLANSQPVHLPVDSHRLFRTRHVQAGLNAQGALFFSLASLSEYPRRLATHAKVGVSRQGEVQAASSRGGWETPYILPPTKQLHFLSLPDSTVVYSNLLINIPQCGIRENTRWGYRDGVKRKGGKIGMHDEWETE